MNKLFTNFSNIQLTSPPMWVKVGRVVAPVPKHTSLPARPRSPRPLPWPCARLTPAERGGLAAMAELSGLTVSAFVRDAILAAMIAEHRRLFPGVEVPWPAPPVPGDVVHRAAEASP